MKFSLPINQLEFEQASALGRHVYDLSTAFMDALGFTQVWVSKYYFDGRYLDITNDLAWKEIMVTNNHYRDFVTMFLEPLQMSPLKSQLFIWQSQPMNEQPFLEKGFHHGILSGFNMVRMHEDHIENYGFGSPNEALRIINNLPNRTELEMLCLHLREGVLKMDCLKEPVLGNIGQSFQPSQPIKAYSNTPVPQFFSFACNGCEAKLSRQELICLGFMTRGYAIKDSARVMNLSPRTVEFHLNQIKAKLNHPAKITLITTFNASPLSTVDPLLLLETE